MTPAKKKDSPAPLTSSDPHSLPAFITRYLTWLQTRNYSPRTVGNCRHALTYFANWCAERSLTRPADITKPMLERYQRWLFHYRSVNGKPLSFRSQHVHLVPIRTFFKWLAKHNHLLYNPASELELPKLDKRLPKHVLSVSEVERILNGVDLKAPLGLRDRAILETLYSTGMRRMELIHLHLYDLDSERGTVMIRQGKGQKDRLLPIGERASAWIAQYLDRERPVLANDPDDGTLFLTHRGDALSGNRLSQLVAEYVAAAQLGKDGSCHLFRHTMATLMLEHGADIRFIQQMLGHAQLSTTEVYTQVSIRTLQAVHAATHPGAHLRRGEPENKASPSLDTGSASLRVSSVAQDHLFSTLAAEARDEPE